MSRILKNNIHIDTFEQVFAEEKLKQGLRLFRKPKMFDVQKHTGGSYEFVFFAQTEIKLELKRKGQEIVFTNCSCTKKLCEHLAAAIFYFQKDVPANLTNQKAGNSSLKTRLTELRNLLPMRGKESDMMVKILNYCARENKKTKFVSLLASVCVLTEKAAENRHSSVALKEGITNLVLLIKEFNLQKLNSVDKDSLIQTTRLLLSNYKKFETSAYSLLIPVCAVAIENKKLLMPIKQDLAKRNVKQLFPGNINWKLVSLILLDLGDESKQSEWISFSEYYIANFERQRCLKNEIKAHQVLKEGFEKLKKSKPANFASFLEYAMEASRGFAETEWFFVKQVIFYSPQIPLHVLNVIPLLFPDAGERKRKVDDLIKQLRLDNKEATFDKVAELLFHENRYEELVKEIAKQKNKFWFLNKVVLKMWPETNAEIFSVFASQFGAAIAEARETHYQQYIFSYAMKYIEKLKVPEKRKILEMMMEKTGKHSYIRNYIQNSEMINLPA